VRRAIALADFTSPLALLALLWFSIQLMPELPDIVVYIDALRERIEGKRIEKIRLASPFFLRTFDPPKEAFVEKTLLSVTRIGKRLLFEFEDELFAIIHLMIAGRFKWLAAGAKIPGKLGLAAFDFDNGSLLVTEAGSRKRASLHLARGRAAVQLHDRGGVEPLDASLEEFRDALTRERHTLKRTLTDPTIFSGIGNSYSDEILHRARLSPTQLSSNLNPQEVARLYDATRSTLLDWIEHLQKQRKGGFPLKVTAFRDEMAVHGKFGKPCPICRSPVQRIVHADNETNYCARCQTGGKLLADRALSKLLKSDWPRTLEEMEDREAELKSES